MIAILGAEGRELRVLGVETALRSYGVTALAVGAPGARASRPPAVSTVTLTIPAGLKAPLAP